MEAFESHRSFELKQMSRAPFLPDENIFCQPKLFNGSSHRMESFPYLERLPLDPYSPATCQDSIERRHKQALKTRTILLTRNDKNTQKKQKIEQYVRGDNLTTSGMELKGYDSHNVKKWVIEQSSVASCVTNSNNTTKGICLQHAYNSSNSSIHLNSYQAKQEIFNFSKRNNKENPSLSSDDIGPVISTDEKICVFKEDSLEVLDAENANPLNITDLVNSELSSSGEPKCMRPAFSLLMFKGEFLPRPEVPVGPRFQAEIPDLMDASTLRNNCTGDDAFGEARWLGSQTWPMEGHCTEKFPKIIGEGRLNYCSCELPGSRDCIKQHIAEAREILAANLGPVFLTWKFDEIGQQVSSTWTLKEEECFAHLINRNPLARVANFWDRAVKRLPRKCRKSILSYYYNVFIPKRMSNQFRSALDHIVSDDDEP